MPGQNKISVKLQAGEKMVTIHQKRGCCLMCHNSKNIWEKHGVRLLFTLPTFTEMTCLGKWEPQKMRGSWWVLEAFHWLQGVLKHRAPGRTRALKSAGWFIRISSLVKVPLDISHRVLSVGKTKLWGCQQYKIVFCWKFWSQQLFFHVKYLYFNVAFYILYFNIA